MVSGESIAATVCDVTITPGANAAAVELPSGLGIGRFRRPAVATVALLWAVAAMRLASPEMWRPYLRETLGGKSMSALALVGTLPIPLSLLWAALSDSAASRGMRREGFVIAGALLAAAGWALAAFL